MTRAGVCKKAEEAFCGDYGVLKALVDHIWDYDRFRAARELTKMPIYMGQKMWIDGKRHIIDSVDIEYGLVWLKDDKSGESFPLMIERREKGDYRVWNGELSLTRICNSRFIRAKKTRPTQKELQAGLR